MDITVGTCSLCGGRVTIPQSYMSTVPPIPTCQSCYATKAEPYGRIIHMKPAASFAEELRRERQIASLVLEMSPRMP